jgi:hypothetical protein
MKKILGLAVSTLALCSTCAYASSDVFRIYAPGIQATPQTAAAPTFTYATLNPADEGANTTLSNGNLTSTSYAGSGVRANMGKSSGKWYWEVTLNSFADGAYPAVLGITSGSTSLHDTWLTTPNYSYYPINFGGYGQLIWSNNSRTSFGSPATVGEVVGIALDLDNLTMKIYVNGVLAGVAYSTFPAGTYYPYVTDPQGGIGPSDASTETVNFGQKPLAYAPPAGYNAGWYQ